MRETILAVQIYRVALLEHQQHVLFLGVLSV